MNSQISISYLNVNGLHNSRLGCKLDTADLVNNITRYDISILSETWGCSHDTYINGFDSFSIKPSKHKHLKSGRASGGLTLYYKHYLSDRIKLKEKSKHHVWIKIKSSVQDIFDKTKDLYLCALYIPPSNSPYYSDDIFINFQDDIIKFGKNEDCILLEGDMNGRSARIQDFIDTSGNKHIDDIPPTLVNNKRNNIDPQTNSHGLKLINLCKTCNLRIINGRKIGDSFGKPTYFSSEGSCSAIDYSVISENFFHQVPSFIVKPQSLISDRCQIVSWLKTPIDLKLKCKQFDDTYNWKKITAQIPLEFSVKL